MNGPRFVIYPGRSVAFSIDAHISYQAVVVSALHRDALDTSISYTRIPVGTAQSTDLNVRIERIFLYKNPAMSLSVFPLIISYLPNPCPRHELLVTAYYDRASYH